MRRSGRHARMEMAHKTAPKGTGLSYAEATKIETETPPDTFTTVEQNKDQSRWQPDSQQAVILPTLNYYLTFTRYFGFTINGTNHDSASVQASAPNNTASRRQVNKLQGTRLIWLALAFLGIVAESVAVAFTTFIAVNHCAVLVDYIVNNTKSFMDLLIEIRLALTKLSALIFVLSWRRNRHQARRLVRLVKSTGIYILGVRLRANQNKPDSPARSRSVELNPALTLADTEQTIIAAKQEDSSPEVESAEARLSSLDSSIVRWWIMSLCVTMLHFSVSEAELLRSHHLWQWLDDYSLHTLDNTTVADSTLMLLVSLDNYIYTVHVYGTRLFGASIICIVCSIQIESIRALERQALSLIRASPPTRPLVQPQHLCSWWYNGLGVAAPCQSGQRVAEHLDRPQSTKYGLFVLGERDWFVAAPNESAGTTLGFSWLYQELHSRICHFVGQFSIWIQVQLLAGELQRLAARHYALSRRSSLSERSRFMSLSSRQSSQVSRATVAPSSSRNERAAQALRSKPGTPTGFRATFAPWTIVDHQSVGLVKHRWATGLNRAQSIERHLERLAGRYELICSVNSQIEACFGPMLLVQYSFLFLMSCMDVVFFSILFDQNTKTKCIIISGMILLWWPYLLMYKFSSDLGSSSNSLLRSVKRLARLCLVEYHQRAAQQELEQVQLKSMQPLDTFRSQCHLVSRLCGQSRPVASRLWRHKGSSSDQTSCCNSLAPVPGRIVNKLDQLFKPTYLSLLGIMKVDKFFLLNFAKIIITASVMMIQFISR